VKAQKQFYPQITQMTQMNADNGITTYKHCR